MKTLVRVDAEAWGKLSGTKGKTLDSLEEFMDFLYPSETKKHKLITEIIKLFPPADVIGQDTDQGLLSSLIG